ncbi:hypothetical protein [Dyella koreensis]|uniref:Uncharacterized protein n=1 Tax=Dyella koreensis TaxID=311235 RepID=A0ABW8K8S3_9GAMM
MLHHKRRAMTMIEARRQMALELMPQALVKTFKEMKWTSQGARIQQGVLAAGGMAALGNGHGGSTRWFGRSPFSAAERPRLSILKTIWKRPYRLSPKKKNRPRGRLKERRRDCPVRHPRSHAYQSTASNRGSN